MIRWHWNWGRLRFLHFLWDWSRCKFLGCVEDTVNLPERRVGVMEIDVRCARCGQPTSRKTYRGQYPLKRS